MKNFAEMMKQASSCKAAWPPTRRPRWMTMIEGRSGGGMVVVMLTGKGDMATSEIDPSLVKPEDAEILEDFIVAAHNDAKAEVEEAMKDKMKTLTGGLPLPPA